MPDWSMEGPYLKTCNCDPGCPCDFNQAPTHGQCHGIAALSIEKGHFGDVSLDGTKWIGLLKWPGRIDEGDGDIQAIVDAESDEQREAIGEILSGAHGGTIFQILDAVCPHKHDPIFAPIDFEWDIDARTARVTAGDFFETTAETLRGIDPPDPYRVRVHIPGGFEYLSEDECAEVALATRLRSTTEITMDVTDGNADFAYVKHAGSS